MDRGVSTRTEDGTDHRGTEAQRKQESVSSKQWTGYEAIAPQFLLTDDCSLFSVSLTWLVPSGVNNCLNSRLVGCLICTRSGRLTLPARLQPPALSVAFSPRFASMRIRFAIVALVSYALPAAAFAEEPVKVSY